MGDLRQRLDDLKMAVPAGREPAPPHAVPAPIRLADLLGGYERPCGDRACWHVETHFEHACARQALAFPRRARDWQSQLLPTPVGVVDPQRAIVLDIETGGFPGTGVFLIGVVPLDARPLRVVQFLARDYPEEESILQALAELAEERDTWVTFNGKSFDEPFIRDRAAACRVTLRPPALHVDLLHAARRRWKGELPDCRLQTLERHVLGWQRVGDVPGSDIPDLFHHFMRTGNAAPVRPIVEHNQLDLISCTELLHVLA